MRDGLSLSNYSHHAVATIGASLEEFAGDIRSILDAKLKNL